MKNAGYYTAFYYGGDLNFGNMNTYLRTAEMDKVVGGDEFAKKHWSSEWGANDAAFLKRVNNDLSKIQKMPFFVTALTLSSHKPFLFSR